MAKHQYFRGRAPFRAASARPLNPQNRDPESSAKLVLKYYYEWPWMPLNLSVSWGCSYKDWHQKLAVELGYRMLLSKLILVASTTLFVFYWWMTARQIVRDFVQHQ
jgi:hypothetical protein